MDKTQKREHNNMYAKQWRENNKEKNRINVARSSTRRFILELGTRQELIEFRGLIDTRLQAMTKNNKE